jgi:[acyl-carrier-protein] S-malonyltransferase
MTKAVTNKGTTAMSALVVRADKLESLVTAMDEIKASLPAGELAEIANINSVRSTSRSFSFLYQMIQLEGVTA